MNLTELFGEAWCVTLAPGDPSEALERMGVAALGVMPDGLKRATERLVLGDDSGVLLLGCEVAAGWTLVVELEGTTGWVGANQEVLAALSGDGRTAVSAYEDPNQLTVHMAVNGAVLGWLDAVTGRRFGEDFGSAGEALTAAGFPDTADGEPSGEAAALEPSERAALALREVTGVQLEDDHLEGPWLGGISVIGA
ncbi:DUF6461 domain-containing protein (plasmid) [Streptomyces sp. NBC_01166]|uniref:DUF6461 domain-containing protein n=1 Tax=Streptomyces sp. NBC_01166 TaxID=2903755 RepID=UPI002F912A5E|nr:DUF6461 domain-containing protein [Streptomyces sp. NBC_01166]